MHGKSEMSIVLDYDALFHVPRLISLLHYRFVILTLFLVPQFFLTCQLGCYWTLSQYQYFHVYTWCYTLSRNIILPTKEDNLIHGCTEVDAMIAIADADCTWAKSGVCKFHLVQFGGITPLYYCNH